MRVKELVRLLNTLPRTMEITIVHSSTSTETIWDETAIRVCEGRLVIDAENVTNQAKYVHLERWLEDNANG